MGYIRKRLRQPSTWLGIAAAASALLASGGSFSPDVIASLLAAAGLVQIDERKEVD